MRFFFFLLVELVGALSFVFSIFSSKTGFITLRCRSFLMQELLMKIYGYLGKSCSLEFLENINTIGLKGPTSERRLRYSCRWIFATLRPS
jgi:hypothetical protein